jgi:cyclic-di-GMP-binding biofilm dispersal mediator protein
MNELTGRKAFITGGSRGIGEALVRRFAAAGAAVTFTYASSQAEATALAEATKTKAMRVDNADRDAVIAAVAAEGPIDILIANAGIAVLGDPFSLDPDAIDRMIDINIRGAYFACIEAARAMPDHGRILVIGATGGDYMPFPGAAAYAMTKAALQGLVHGLARDVGPRGITVNALQLGPVDTAMNPAASPVGEMVRGRLAIPRYARPDEVADYALFLASPAAAMITGSMQVMDGGFMA